MTTAITLESEAAVDFDESLVATSCLNCGTMLHGAFCSHCGQSQLERITLRSMAHEVAGQVLEIDHGLLHTFVDLLRRPGAMIREYLAGRRRYYTSPIAYMLIASGLSLLRSALAPDTKKALASLKTLGDPSVTRLFGKPERIAFFNAEVALTQTNRFVIAALLLIPITLTLRLLFRKRGINLAEMAVFTCYTFGQATLLSVIIAGALLYVISAPVVSAIFIALAVIYPFYAGFGLFGRSFGTAMRIAGAIVLGVVLMDTIVYTLPFIVVR